MRLFLLLVMLSSSFASQLISTDQIEDLFKKFMNHELSEAEEVKFHEVIEILRRPEPVFRGFDYDREPKTTIACIACQSVFGAATYTVKKGVPEELLIPVMTTLCKLLRIGTHAVCKGAVELNWPIMHHIIKTAPETTSRTFCGLLLQNAHNSNICPLTDSRFEWTVELPPTPAVTHVPVADGKPLTVAILTDYHIDPLYEAYGVADCKEPTCCHKGQSPATFRHNLDAEEPIIISQSIVNDHGSVNLDLDKAKELRHIRSMENSTFDGKMNSPPAGYWGDYRNCDSPKWAFDDAIDRIVETHKDIDAVYYIGDSINHFVWETTYEMINEVNRYAIEKMRKSFGKDVVIIPVIGNHESQPVNQFAPSSVTDPKFSTRWLYEALANKWRDYIPEDAVSTFKESGQYSILLRPGLRVIVLNNIVSYKYNWWLVYDPQDSKKHLEWLVEELRKSELAGENVHILAHIPPGVSDLVYTWTREYNRIINRFSSIIKAEFNGHTHYDEFKLYYSLKDGSPINVAWGAGSVTSHTYNNLNYKIATFDGAKYEPQNIINYAYNLTEANLTPNVRPRWFQLYDMKDTYRMKDLSAASVDDLVHRMVNTDTHLLDKYVAFYSKHSEVRMSSPCEDECKFDYVCNIVVTVLWERQRCEELKSIFYSRNTIGTNRKYRITNIITENRTFKKQT